MNIQSLFTSLSWNQRLEVLRIIKNWSQDQAAQECGTTKKNYWLWESGKTYPRNNSRRAISLAFGIPQEEIF